MQEKHTQHNLEEFECFGHIQNWDALIDAISIEDMNAFEKALENETMCFGFIAQSHKHIIAASDMVRGYPLFYNESTGQVSFNVHDLSDQFGQKLLSDETALLEFCMAGYVLGQKTLHRDIKTLQAGEYLILDKATGNIHVTRYDRYLPCPKQDMAYDEAMKTLGHTLDKAINKVVQAAQGREIWVPLSGGFDSRLILAKLHEHNAPNLKTFSYGLKGNDEAKIAKQLANILGVPWHMIEAQPNKAQALYLGEMRQNYEQYAHGYSVIPSYVEFEAIYRLKESGLAKTNSFIVNGQTGDFLSGGHVPKPLFESDRPTKGDMLDYIIEKHFSMWQSLKTDGNNKALKRKIESLLPTAPNDLNEKEQLISQYESFEWAERQAKMVVQGHSVYDYFGYQWAMPLWDKGLIRFFEKAPFAFKYKQKLYVDYVHRYNYKGLFDVPRAKVKTFRGPLRIPILAIGKLLELTKGRDAKEDFYKSMRYYGHFNDQFALFGRALYKKHYKDMRNIISLSILDFLEKRGIEFPRS